MDTVIIIWLLAVLTVAYRIIGFHSILHWHAYSVCPVRVWTTISMSAGVIRIIHHMKQQK